MRNKHRTAGVVFVIGVLLPFYGLAEEVEHDRCTCKVVQIGAESTLAGGICVRTESSKCLMEWGGASKEKVSLGNGLSQQESSDIAWQRLSTSLNHAFKLQRLTDTPAELPLQIALANLSRVPPKEYEAPGMAESFVLAAATALARFEGVPLDRLGQALMGSNREALIGMLQKEGEFTIEPFRISGTFGCLRIAVASKDIHVFVKTPFAATDAC